MRVFSRLSAVNRICFARFLPAAIGCVGAACALLPTPDVTVKTLRSGPIAVDSTGVVFNLRSGVTDARHPELCLILDTLHYVFHPRAEKFHPLQLTDTTVYPRDAGTHATTPIALKAVLEGRNGERVESSGGGYSPGNGMDTPYNRAHLLGEEGEVVCLGWNARRPGITYVKLRFRSTRPIVVHELTWHYLSRT
jgi:hypothetical protein